MPTVLELTEVVPDTGWSREPESARPALPVLSTVPAGLGVLGLLAPPALAPPLGDLGEPLDPALDGINGMLESIRLISVLTLSLGFW